MKPIRSILITALLTCIVFSTVVYTACQKDKCNNVKCQNLGVCDGGNCVCLTGYEGSRCEIYSRDKFVSTFNGGDICAINDTNHYHQYPLYFTAVLSAPLELTLKNFLNNPQDSAICTMQSTDSFLFSGRNNGTTYSGYGTLKNDTLRMKYTVQIDTGNLITCGYLGGSNW